MWGRGTDSSDIKRSGETSGPSLFSLDLKCYICTMGKKALRLGSQEVVRPSSSLNFFPGRRRCPPAP